MPVYIVKKHKIRRISKEDPVVKDVRSVVLEFMVAAPVVKEDVLV